MFRILRILLLLLMFAGIAFYTKTQRLQTRSWAEPLHIVIFPINGDNSPIVEAYINNLQDSVFRPIDDFIQQESQHYSIIARQPTITRLGSVTSTQPPISPAPDANLLEIAWWGLRFRYWASRNTPDNASNHHRIRIFVHYHEALPGKTLPHSLGLDKGLLAVVHAFASRHQQAQNNIVIAHELLHTVGATDKYDHNNQPVFPDGYADPQQQPLYPQQMAEIMAGRIALSPESSQMPNSLDECLVGKQTAAEINWLQEPPNDR